MASIVQLGAALREKFLESFFVYSDSVDYFNLLNTLGTLFPMHCDATGLRKLLRIAYRTLYMLSYLSYCYKAAWISCWEFNMSVINILSALGICSGALLRVLLIELNYPAIRSLQMFLNDRTYHSSDRSWTWERRSRLYRQGNRFLVIVVIVIVFQSICFLFSLLMTGPEFMLQYKGEVIGGLVVQIVYGAVTACWGIVYILTFIVFYMIMAGFRLEMEILLRSFQQLDDLLLAEHGEFVRVSLPGSERDGQAFWSDFTAKLRERIVRHVALLENLRKLRSIVAPFALLQYYSTFVLVAVAGFVVYIEGFSGYRMAYVLFASSLVLEAFLLSRSVEQLNEQNHRIGMALYELDWPRLLRYSARFRREYNGIQRTILVTIVQTQCSLRFNYGAQREISMNSFAELMQKTYSVLTFMLQLGNYMEDAVGLP